MKKFSIIVGLLLLFSAVTPTIANEADFAENEAYYRDLCTSTLTSDDRAVCTSFQEYLNSKIETAQSSIDDISSAIASVENDIAQVDELIHEQQIQIEAAEAEIIVLDETIVVMEESIVELEIQIDERAVEILKVEKQIKERLVSEQGNMYTNTLVNFLFGGRSYTEMIRRADTVTKINQYNKDQMDWFTEEKRRLVDDQEELERQKLVLEDSLENTQILKESLEVAKAQAEETVAQYQAQVDDLVAKQLELEAQQSISSTDLDSILGSFADLDSREEALRLEAERLAAEAEAQRQAAIDAAEEAERLAAEERAKELQDQSDQANQDADDIANGGGGVDIGTGSGWIRPVNNALITAGVWYYPSNGVLGGSVHNGMDFATSVGTSIFSTGPGVVVYTYTGCPTYGWLGNSCGGYGGNQVISIVSVNNSLYALKYMHLQSANVSIGTQLDTYSVIGTVGSSGSSTGPHLHYEIIYLGDMSLSTYLNNWDGAMNFTNQGVAMTLDWICDVKGPPCRVNPSSVHGLNVGDRY
ncbi:MAG TPA: peptidoglycan DD-metalloendopeptidase family protein [Erysipelothrix sp.]|jgi:murein DD-endopeptidase MepM/ murein hydrolase activator NlpD|nr:peptidoglycan DD-metalloendopeptidase family protein [Erysipelothrix sp.]